jgi:hypothetical protein
MQQLVPVGDASDARMEALMLQIYFRFRRYSGLAAGSTRSRMTGEGFHGSTSSGTETVGFYERLGWSVLDRTNWKGSNSSDGPRSANAERGRGVTNGNRDELGRSCVARRARLRPRHRERCQCDAGWKVLP